MKISITGASGFIGVNLIEHWKNRGDTLQLLSRKTNDLYSGYDNIIQFEGDLLRLDSIDTQFWDCDCLIHLANNSNPQLQDPISDIDNNLIPFIHLLKQATKFKVPRIVFTSTAAVYGDTSSKTVAESTPRNPISYYGIIKAAMEQALQMEQGTSGWCVLRLANPYGPGQHSGAQGVVANFLQAALTNSPLNIYGDGTAIRDFIYIDDIVSAIYKATHSSSNGVYNIGSGQATPLSSLINNIEEVFNKRLVVNYLPSRGFEIKRMVFDVSEARQDLKWHANTPLAQGLKAHKAWLINQLP